MLETINRLAIELYGVPIERIDDEDIWNYIISLAEIYRHKEPKNLIKQSEEEKE